MRTLVSLLTSAISLFAGQATKGPYQVIPLSETQKMFDGIKANTKWDMAKPMLWGFFFIHDTPGPLEKAGKVLADQGYRVVQIYQDDQKENWWLHVEKIEIHTVQSLHQRNIELTNFAKQTGLKDYDGNDVGPVQ